MDLSHFNYQHMPPIHQAMAAKFYDLAHEIHSEVGPSDERNAGMRRLIEARDCIIRTLEDQAVREAVHGTEGPYDEDF